VDDGVSQRLRLDDDDVRVMGVDYSRAITAGVGSLLMVLLMVSVWGRSQLIAWTDVGGLFMVLGSLTLCAGRKRVGFGGGLVRRRSVALDEHIRRSSLGGE